MKILPPGEEPFYGTILQYWGLGRVPSEDGNYVYNHNYLIAIKSGFVIAPQSIIFPVEN